MKSKLSADKVLRKKRKRVYVLSIIALLLIVFTIWVAWGNSALMVTEITVLSDKIPSSFSGYRIAQISDLHNDEFGEDNKDLLELLESARPDIIVITGDMIDSYNTDISIALSFAKNAKEIAPIYYVNGNHEARIDEYPQLLQGLKELGVTVLENEKIKIENDGEYITLIGVNDPSYKTDYLFGDPQSVMTAVLENMDINIEEYNVLLSHRPELFDCYVKSDVDLVFTGHAHGGQFRLPFIGGVAAPGQGLFPKYDSGLYTESTTNMIVSRGIGNSLFPFRINNRPEIVVAELQNSA